MSVNSKMTAIADKIRILKGITEPMGLDDMAIELEAIPKNDSNDLTVSGATVTVPVGYYSSSATKSVATATQATPSITINASGLITASATQSAGYVDSGTKSATQQLTTQAAKTIIPSTSSQTAVESGVYTTGKVTVGAIPSSYVVPTGTVTLSSNGTFDVKNYASATVNVAASGGDTSVEDGIIMRTLSGAYENSRVTYIYSSTFYSCSKLTTVNFPAVTSIGTSAFYGCNSLVTASFSAATSIGSSAFGGCSKLTTVNFPAATSTGTSAFYGCSKLTTVNFPAMKYINSNAFYGCNSLVTASFPANNICASAFRACYNLTSFYLTGSSICKLSNSNAFSSTPIGGYSGYTKTSGSIYVPASLLTSYQTATNWTYFSSRFVGI